MPPLVAVTEAADSRNKRNKLLVGKMFAKLSSSPPSLRAMTLPQSPVASSFSEQDVESQSPTAAAATAAHRSVTPPLPTLIVPFQTHGVLLSHLKSLSVPGHFTTLQVVKTVFRELTKEDKLQSYAQWLQRTRPEFVQPVAQHYVVHTHLEIWSELMDALPIDEANPDRFVWLDCACVSQHGVLDNPVADIREFLERDIKNVEMAVVPLQNPISTRRTWCHFELITSHKLGKPVQMRAPQAQILAFRKTVVSPNFDLTQSLDFFDKATSRARDKFNCTRDSEYSSIINTVVSNADQVMDALGRFYCDHVLAGGLVDTSVEDKLKLLYVRGHIKKAIGHLSEAESIYSRAVQHLTKSPSHGKVWQAQALLADMRRMQGDFTGAMALYDQATSNRKAGHHMGGGGKSSPQEQLVLARHELNVGMCLRGLKKFKEAKSKLEDALHLRRAVLGDSHGDVAEVLAVLGDLQLDRGNTQDALVFHEEALAIRRSDAVVHPEAFADELFAVGELYLRSRVLARACESFFECYNIRNRTMGEHAPATIAAEAKYGLTLMMMEKYDKARPVMYHVVDASKRVLGLNHADTATNISNLALLLSKQNSLEESCRLYEQVIAIRKKVLAPECIEVARTFHALAFVLRERDLTGQAVGLGRMAADMAKKVGREREAEEMKRWWY